MTKNEMIQILKERFTESMHLHEDVLWEDVNDLLTDDKVNVMIKMEEAGGDINIVRLNGQLHVVDTVKETTEERSSITYDQAAQDSRAKEKLPIKGNAVSIAQERGVELLNETDYFELQQLDDFDLKTSVWLLTPDDVRKKGGALFGDKRYGRAFIYHNGAKSFYKVRGYRTKLKLQ